MIGQPRRPIEAGGGQTKPEPKQLDIEMAGMEAQPHDCAFVLLRKPFVCAARPACACAPGRRYPARS